MKMVRIKLKVLESTGKSGLKALNQAENDPNFNFPLVGELKKVVARRIYGY